MGFWKDCKASEAFFFEKKNQKTFVPDAVAIMRTGPQATTRLKHRQEEKVFWSFFSKKDCLPSLSMLAYATMEIHSPEHPLRSLRDFAFHIFTVTIGILIALGLEALVQAYHGKALAQHARAEFRDEFSQNRTALLADQPKLLAMRTEVEGLIAYGQARIAHKPAALPDLQAARGFAFANSTAWETAVATQAVLNMSFAETRAVSTAVIRQTAFNALQSRAEDQWFELAAFSDPRTIPDDQLAPALQKITIAYAYIRSVDVMEKDLVGIYDKTLRALQ